jgi:translation initiation factor IF-1
MSTPIDIRLRKCVVTQSLGHGRYLTQDVQEGKTLTVQLRGKDRMNYIKILPGDELYAKFTPNYNGGCYLFISESKFKRSDNLYDEKLALDKAIAEQK